MGNMIDQNVLNERHNDYGSFIDNMCMIKTLLPFISIEMDNENIFSKSGSEIGTAIEFTRYMLALKAARSTCKTISSAAKKDCVVDFNNYKHLIELNYGVIVTLSGPLENPAEGSLVDLEVLL